MDDLRDYVDLTFNQDYQAKDQIHDKKQALLADAVNYRETGILRKGFVQDFFAYITDLTFQMVSTGEDYYALFLNDTVREADLELPFPTASVLKGNKILFLFNPLWFVELETREAIAMIKHEVLHILLKHHARERALKPKFRKLAINLAMDISVNQYLSHLPPYVERINSVNRRFDLQLRTGETLEFYTEAIHQAIEEHPQEASELTESQEVNYAEVHDRWAESEDEQQDEVKDKLKSTLRYASKNGIPDEVQKILHDQTPAEVPWGRVVGKALRTLPKGQKKTVTRVNRRQPERLDLRGELKNHIPDITVAVDISGSIDDKAMNGFLREILSLSRRYKESIRILECDDAIRRDYRIRSLKDIQPLLKRRGGTRFSPVMEKLKEENQRDTLLIYFTDGQGERQLELRPIHHKTLWMVKGDKLSLADPHGDVIYLRKETPENEPTYGIQVMRAMLNDWAR